VIGCLSNERCFAEEVVESALSTNHMKYRAVEEAQAEGVGDELAAVADEDFDWLEPQDFVAAYKASEHYAHVIETIDETNKHLSPKPAENKVRILFLSLLQFGPIS
jgi:hypothetical protein